MKNIQNTLSFLDKYAIFRKASDSDDTVLRDNTNGNLVLMREVLIDDHQAFRNIIETLEAQKQLTHNHLLSLLEYHVKSTQQDDTTYQKIITFYKYSTHSLMQELEARAKEGRPFEQSELWNILCGVVLALGYLQQENIGHGSVSLLDMYITPDGLVKIVDPSIASSSPFNFMDGYYYSPEILRYYSSNEQQDSINIFKSDVFSLAVCMIQAALLDPVDDCIDYDSLEINFDVLQSRLEVVGQNYSQDFVSILAEMLSEEPVDRPDMLALQERLMAILNQESIEESEGLEPMVCNLEAMAPEGEDFGTSAEYCPNSSCTDCPSRPDELLEVPPARVPQTKQTTISNRNISLQSSIRSRFGPETSITVENVITIPVTPTSISPKVVEEAPLSKRKSTDVKITVIPPARILEEPLVPAGNKDSSFFYEDYLKNHEQNKHKLPEYSSNKVTIKQQSQNRPPSNYHNYNTTVLTDTHRYKTYSQANTNVAHYPQYPPSHNPMEASTFRKKTTFVPQMPPTAASKLPYGLNHLAPLQSQSIQFSVGNQMGPTQGGVPLKGLSGNPGIQMAQPILANTNLAPMITSNAVGSRENSHLFTDPKLLSMMRADLKKFETYTYGYVCGVGNYPTMNHNVF